MELNNFIRARLTSLLLRLAVELEEECCASAAAGGDVFDIPLQWLDENGFQYLLAGCDEFGSALPRSIEKLQENELDVLLGAGEVVRRALFVADEIQQLGGEAALDFVAGWIGGYCNKSGDDFIHYVSCFISRIPLYRESFKAGFQNGYGEGVNQRSQNKMVVRDESLRFEGAGS